MDNAETITFVSVNGGGTASFSSLTSGTTGCITLSNSNLLSSTRPGANGKVEIRSTLPFTQIVFTAAGLYQVLKVNNFTTSAPTNTSPTITALVNQSTSGTIPTEGQDFTVADAETAVDSLVVTASSSNTTLIPNANITLSTRRLKRVVVVTAASGQKGTATITLTVTDAQGANSTTTFTVTITDPTCSPFKITDFQLNGNATAASSIITLTPAQGNRFGGFWNKKKVYLDQDFDISSKVFLGNNDVGADGMAFVLQNQSISAGTAGGGVGYAGITPSFAVEFDTYYNGGIDPGTGQDHIALVKNGEALSLAAHSEFANPYYTEMEDGRFHNVRFVWTASTKNFQVYYEGIKRFDVTVDLKASIFNNADFVYWGFAAATGGLNNLHQVDIGEYCYVPQATITPTAGTENATAALTFCSGADVVLEASYSASYKWYKDNVLLSNTSQTYTATETGSYKVETVSNIGAITSFSDAVAVKVNAGPSFSYAAASYTFIRNNAITNLSPSLATGSTPVTSYSVTPSLPDGLNLNTTTGVISGTPSAGSTSTNYIVTATNANGCSSTDTLAIEISECTLSPSVVSNVLIVGYGDDRIAVLKTSGLSALGTQDNLVGSLMVANGAEYKLTGTWTSDNNYYYFRTSPRFPFPGYQTYAKVSFRCNSNPIITGPNGTGTTIEALAAKSIAENSTAVGSYLADETVTWSISGTDASKFTMSASGVLTFSTAPDYEVPADADSNNTYIVIITATDASGNTTTQTLTVTVTDVDDTPPIITGPNGSGTTTATTAAKSITENTTAVGSYTADETVTWSISGTDASKFSISASGVLTFSTAPDYEVPADADSNNTYMVTTKATDAAGNMTSQTLTVTVTDVNEVPTNIALSASSIAEDNEINAIVGSLSSTDVDAGDTHIYTLVSGTGSSDNATFRISGKSLKVNIFLDFEAKSSYSIRVKTTDAGGLSYEKVFTITVTNVNEAPTNIASSQTAIYEANANGAAVSNLSSTDPDAGDTFTYTLVSGTGSTDNASFSISGNQLKANTVFVFNTKSTYSIRLRTTDAGGLTFEKVFTITVLESPFATGTGNVLGTSTITAESNNVTISKGYSSQLRVRGTGLVTYSWSPSTGLSSTNIVNPIASPTQTTVYAVRVTNNMGLSTTVYVTVNVVEDYNVTPHNILTPNGDGVNDKWVIDNLSAYPINQVQIFDRAGRLMFVESTYQNGWDGTLNGLPLHEGTYYYIITFESGIKPKKGFITLVRDNN
jgi:gliding motility-associated-like protein